MREELETKRTLRVKACACSSFSVATLGDGGATKTKLERQDPVGHGGLRSQ